ncbi:ATP-binding cassette domain-containing protein, partial [Frankia nepalensis]|uniref:ATP-binding cassette domain-containing protein n=1 Tax=Frankia nepalensis TaxID=1836974 RepID=UPI002551EBF3
LGSRPPTRAAAAAAPRPRRAPTGDTTPARPGSAAANAVAPALLSVESVTGRYGGRRRGVLALAGGGVPAGAPVVREVSLSVEAGEIVALLGPNGAGKTTLIRMIAGQLPPVAGTITLLGAPTRRTTPDKLARRGLAVVPQGHGSVPTLTVRENLRLAVRHPAPGGAPPRDLVTRTKETLRASLAMTSSDEAVSLELAAQEWSVARPGFADHVRELRDRLRAARR